MKLLLGTKNKDKCAELKRLLRAAAVQVLSLDEAGRFADVTEDRNTFEGNAKKKAMTYAQKSKMLTLADDSGLMVNALNGAPGVYSARFAGKNCSYQDNNKKLLRLLGTKVPSKRGAKFVCVMALYDNKKFVGTVRGECRGRIAFEPRGKNGFGYDPVFIPAGFSKTFAELSPSTKNKISHRSKALKAAVKLIRKHIKSK